MRVIGVIDLKGGVAVHAVRGGRETYRPLRSVLLDGAEPVAVARALRDRLGIEKLYVADLDAIAGGRGHPETVAALAREARIMVDAGATEAWSHQARAVLGTETLVDLGTLERIPEAVLSLDLRAGRVLSGDPALAALSARAAGPHRRARGSSCSTSRVSGPARARTSR